MLVVSGETKGKKMIEMKILYRNESSASLGGQ